MVTRPPLPSPRAAVAPPAAAAGQATGIPFMVPLGLGGHWYDDLYHQLLRASWRRLLVVMAIGYFTVNAIFGTAYLVVGGIEGADPGSFADAFFFSVQTLNTIGYGGMVPRTTAAHAVVFAEAFVGLLSLAMATGLVFSKFARPTARVMFSRNPIIANHDGVPTLQFRVANERANQIVEAQLRLVLVRNEITKEGTSFRRILDLALVRSSSSVFIMTWTALHPITPSSPLHGCTPETLAASDALIVVSMTGLDETFAQTIHARHWYTGKDIRWNARYADLITQLPDGRRAIDYAKFHDLVETVESKTAG